jgi:hypothetical protein
MVEEWESIQYIDFTKNCVLIDEAGFNMHTSRNFGRSLRGTPAKGIVPTGSGSTDIYTGCHISSRGNRHSLEKTTDWINVQEEEG